MKAKTLKLFLILLAFSFVGCEDFLDRTPLTRYDDENFWESENNLRAYAKGFNDHFFRGYGIANNAVAAAMGGFLFSDDIQQDGNQTNFAATVPNSTGGTSVTDGFWIANHSGNDWNFSWIRKANVMVDRINSEMGSVLDDDAKNHWLGVARFFRALNYASMVSVFGDVPYFDREVFDGELDELYKPRTPRNEVMDRIFDDFVFAMENVKGNLSYKSDVNGDVVAAFVTRWALFEGTWQKYHENDNDRAKKFLELAVRAGDIIIASGRYEFTSDFRSLFGSLDLSSNKEVILFRPYGGLVTHAQASACNLTVGQYYATTLSLTKAFICNDGSDWITSGNAANKNFELSNLIRTRDPRFEATFHRLPTLRAAASALYITKFIPREALRYRDGGGVTLPIEWADNRNENAYPVMRYAEVVLNWIEAKTELNDVSQADINVSINAIRNRPLDPEAEALGAQKTMSINIDLPIGTPGGLPDTPEEIRGDVSQLLWEIRRERRMEFAFEYGRLTDLKRWKKLEYMDHVKNPDIIRGAVWVKLTRDDISDFGPSWQSDLKDLIGVSDMEGNVTLFDGANAGIEGFWHRRRVGGRQPFLDGANPNPYLAPVGRNMRIDYNTRGYRLDQTPGWPTEL